MGGRQGMLDCPEQLARPKGFQQVVVPEKIVLRELRTRSR